MRRRDSSRIGLKAIAERAGVSVATVSLALSDHPNVNDATKKRVQALSRELGYVTAKDLATRKARRKVERIGFVTVGVDLHDGHGSILGPLGREVEDWNIQLEVRPILGESDEAMIQQILEFGETVDALLITDNITITMMKALDSLEKPCIAFGYIADSNEDVELLTHTRVVAPNDVGMARWTTRWLFRRGHKRVAFITPQLLPGASDDRQHDGWRLACLDAGQMPQPADIFVTARHGSSTEADIAPNVPFAERHEVARYFLEQPEQPDAYYVTDCRLARVFIDGCRELGHELDPATVVVRGPTSHLEAAGVMHHPRIEMDPTLLASTATAILARPDRRVLAEGINILFPLPIHNFD